MQARVESTWVLCIECEVICTCDCLTGTKGCGCPCCEHQHEFQMSLDGLLAYADAFGKAFQRVVNGKEV